MYDKVIKLFQLTPKRKLMNDVWKFVGQLLYNNNKCGILYGEVTSMLSLDDKENIKSRKLFFDLAAGQIIGEGLTDDYNNIGLLTDEHEIAIVGGTKEYVGVTGKIVTKRLENNEHEHILYINW